MTYNVFSGTLNPTQSNYSIWSTVYLFPKISRKSTYNWSFLSIYFTLSLEPAPCLLWHYSAFSVITGLNIVRSNLRRDTVWSWSLRRRQS